MSNLHPVFAQALAPFAPPPRFARTYCSSCGCELGPGDSGVSRCEDHAPTADALAEYRAALANMDWQFEFTEDHRRWATGTNDLARLHKMQRELDPTGEIWLATPGARGHGAPRPRVLEVHA